jgi:hypothetical protein
MKSDLSRETFDHLKHYSSARMQQGRVQVDADWNEQAGITLYRIEREAVDLIGGCGGPIHNAGFGITKEVTSPPTHSIAPVGPNDFILGPGRYYVDGILCEIDDYTLFSKQPDLPPTPGVLPVPVSSVGRFGAYLAYLDVWRRNITALDDPRIREIALGGPDTATRTKTIWQVKLAPVTNNNNCIDAFAELKKQKQPSSGQMSARTAPGAATTDPCIVPSTAGFRGLENQFYRVEIHNPGSGFDISISGGGKAITLTSDPTKINVTGFTAGQAVELFLTGPGTDPTVRKLFYVVSVDSGHGTITLNSSLSGVRQQDGPQIRAVGTTFKWSRDNGSVVTLVTKIDKNDARVLTVLNVGNDSVTGFAPDQWVELIDDTLELNGLPGQLLQIAEVDPARQLITLKSPAAPLSLTSLPSDGVDPAFHPKLRRWDGVGAVDFSSTGFWIGIENGVQVSFAKGSYQNGDYWTIPARTATADAESGNIEWPQDANKLSLSLSPFGIDHHYCPLAMLDSKLSPTSDCRRLFPPVTELTTLLYVDGDGQEAMPKVQLPRPIEVRVANGQFPVIGAKVTFEILTTGGSLSGDGQTGTKVTVTTKAADGIAGCLWTPNDTPEGQGQQVEARLLDAAGRTIPGQVVRFNADLSIASEVSYDPGSCANLKGATTVQIALDRLSHVISFSYIGGDAQFASAAPDPVSRLITLDQPLEVAVASDCGPPYTDRAVVFTILNGNGQLSAGVSTGSLVKVLVDPKTGIALCTWSIDPFDPSQNYRVEAKLLPVTTEVVPSPIHFTASFGEPGFQIVDVVIKDTSSLPAQDQVLRNDTAISAGVFAQRSISIDCSLAVDPGIIRKPTCFVTLDIPFPALQRLSAFTAGTLTPTATGTTVSPGVAASPPVLAGVAAVNAAAFAPAVNLFGFQPFILDSDLSVAGNSIRWKGKPNLLAFFNSVGSAMAQLGFGSRILAHLTVKGNFITAAGNPTLYLDGEVFGLLSSERNTDGEVLLLSPGGTVDIDLQQGIINGPRGRSGDGKRGGDFEMWFFLDFPVQVSRVTFISTGPPTAPEKVTAGPFSTPFPSIRLSVPTNVIQLEFSRPVLPVGIGPASAAQSVILETVVPVTPVNRIAQTLPVPGNLTATSDLAWRLATVNAAPLSAGHYKITALGTASGQRPAITGRDDGVPLDGDFSGAGGRNFVLEFDVAALNL